MRIGISALSRLDGGALTHLRQLLRAWTRLRTDLEHQILLFVRPETVRQLTDVLSPNIKLYHIGQEKADTASKLLWEQFVLPRVAQEARIDVLFCPLNIAPFRSPIPSVVALRNAAPFCPTLTLKVTGLSFWLWLRVLGLFMVWSARVAQRTIFNSFYLRDYFRNRFGISVDQSDVIYHGRNSVDGNHSGILEDSFASRIQKPYILSISHIQPYKNLLELVQGFEQVYSVMERRGMQLIIGGAPDHARYARDLSNYIEQHGLGQSIHLIGRLSYNMTRHLMKECEFFVFTSTCENCPNTLIEALSAGVPIACSNASVMPEIGGDAVIYLDPFDPSDIAQQLRILAEDAKLRNDLSHKALIQAQKFPQWDKVAARTLGSLEQAATSR